ncbi:MAG: AAA family ATPase [Chloroflexota bacterium]
MLPGITSLTVDGFRALQGLTISGFGRVNLITGRNNTGKSSVLEALRILASDGSPSVLFNILRYREEALGDTEESGRLNDVDGLFQLTSLFSGFPRFTENLKPISFRAESANRSLDLTLRVGWASPEGDVNGPRRLVERQATLFGDEEGVVALIVESAGVSRIMAMDKLRRYPYGSRLYRSELAESARLQCVYVSPYGGERTETLGALWDSIALSDRETDVVEALRIIDPQISAVSMVGGESPRQSRTAIVRSSRFARPVPLRSFGDGLNRLFGIVLSLVNAKDGILLIDEFENGMHHTVQLDAWRAIFRLAHTLDVQVFATSHSWDAIEAFQKAAAETPDVGVLTRLSRRDHQIIPTLFGEAELAVATRDRIEVR